MGMGWASRQPPLPPALLCAGGKPAINQSAPLRPRGEAPQELLSAPDERATAAGSTPAGHVRHRGGSVSFPGQGERGRVRPRGAGRRWQELSPPGGHSAPEGTARGGQEELPAEEAQKRQNFPIRGETGSGEGDTDRANGLRRWCRCPGGGRGVVGCHHPGHRRACPQALTFSFSSPKSQSAVLSPAHTPAAFARNEAVLAN